jgi:H+-transporting ATPase
MNLRIEALRTLTFVVLVFGSQAMIYAIRERRHLWGTRPSLLLAVSSVADIAIASTLAVGGIAMTPIPVLLVGGTLAAAIIFAVLSDLVKVPVFVRLGIAQSPRHRPVNQVTPDSAKRKRIPITEPSAGQPEASDLQSDIKAEPKPEAIAEPNSTVKAGPTHEAKAKAKTPTDLTPRIATRAYELYEEGGRKEGAARQNWEKAESEIRNAQVKAEPPRETKAESKPAVKVEPTPAAKEQLQPVPKTEAQPETRGAPNAEMTPASQPETRAETETDVSPQLVQRVQKLYEELGRQDIRAVQDWEKAQEEIRKERSAK